MIPANIVHFETPKKVPLNGLLFGAFSSEATKGKTIRPKRTYIWLHGLTSNAFSKQEIAALLAAPSTKLGAGTAVLTFNNRGCHTVTRFSRQVSKTKKVSFLGGSAHEKFVDCVDDIDGAINFAKSLGTKEIILVGHSTGCQKITYWASKKKHKLVKGLVLLAPVSDYLTVQRDFGAKYGTILKYAKAAIAKGKGGELIPSDVSPQPLDSFRFISLFTKESVENQVFPYFDAKNPARILKKVKVPILALMGEKEEYADRPVEDILKWFREKAGTNITTAMVPEAGHSFKGAESTVVLHVKRFSQVR